MNVILKDDLPSSVCLATAAAGAGQLQLFLASGPTADDSAHDGAPHLLWSALQLFLAARTLCGRRTVEFDAATNTSDQLLKPSVLPLLL